MKTHKTGANAGKKMKAGAGKRVAGTAGKEAGNAGTGAPWEKEQEKRCLSDIEQFYSNVKEVKITDESEYAVELARQYCEDTKFFLKKKDYVTAFGSINYAHGLIDAFRKKREG